MSPKRCQARRRPGDGLVTGAIAAFSRPPQPESGGAASACLGCSSTPDVVTPVAGSFSDETDIRLNWLGSRAAATFTCGSRETRFLTPASLIAPGKSSSLMAVTSAVGQLDPAVSCFATRALDRASATSRDGAAADGWCRRLRSLLPTRSLKRRASPSWVGDACEALFAHSPRLLGYMHGG